MKKLLLTLLLGASLFADAKIYMGLGYENYNESYINTDLSTSNNALKVKAGYGVRDAYAVEFSLDYIDNSTRNSDTPFKAKYGFNVALLKAFDWGIYINPYFKAGFGAGIIDNRDNAALKSNTYGSFTLGTGFFIPITETYDLELSYLYNNLSYEKNDTTQSDFKRSHINILYFGFNTRF